MMIKFSILSFLVVPSLLLSALPSKAGLFNGWATPTSLTYNFTSMNLNSDSATSATLISTPFSVTFKRTDTDFASTSLANIAVPYGRYVSVGLCSTGVTTVNMNGVKFDGQNNAGGLNLGDVIYTGKADNSVGSIKTTGPAVDLTFTDPYAGCAVTVFPSPVCVTDTSQTGCKPGDLIYTSTGATTNTQGDGKGVNTAKASFKVNLMLDLYDSVTMDGSSSGLNVTQISNVIPVVGDPGAAIHLTKHVSLTGTFNASMLFGADKKLLTLFISQIGSGTSGTPLTHSCRGSDLVAITGASVNNPYSFLSSVSTTANTNKGQLMAPIANACQTPATCNSVGTEQIDNFIQTAGNNATIQCVADSATAPLATNVFGMPYVGGAGATAGSDTADIVRIVDPGNVFGVCTTSPCFDPVVAGSDGYY